MSDVTKKVTERDNLVTIPVPPKPRFAPFRLPFRRRLQTLAVLFHTVCIASMLATFFLLCAIPILWPLIIVYLVWASFDNAAEEGKDRRIRFFREAKLWRWYNDYFPIRLHKTHDLDPSRTFIFGYHPHGIISMAAMGNFATEATGFGALFPGITNTLLTLSSNFHIPLYRDYLMAMGLASVSKRNCDMTLARGAGHAITIVIGGAQESLLSRPHSNDLVLRKRLGVIRLAMKHGADLVPVFSFGENDIYEQAENDPGSWLYAFQQTFKKVAGFTLPMFWARGVLNYDFGLMPFRRQINTVIGKPIRVEKNTDPSLEDIQIVQKQYIDALTDLYKTFKDDFLPDRAREMRIVE